MLYFRSTALLPVWQHGHPSAPAQQAETTEHAAQPRPVLGAVFDGVHNIAVLEAATQEVFRRSFEFLLVIRVTGDFAGNVNSVVHIR